MHTLLRAVCARTSSRLCSPLATAAARPAPTTNFLRKHVGNKQGAGTHSGKAAKDESGKATAAPCGCESSSHLTPVPSQTRCALRRRVANRHTSHLL
eukprot:2587269-Pleurochrysis_carterae.AAC.1